MPLGVRNPDVDYTAAREEALALARRGYTATVISRRLGIDDSTVWRWLHGAGFDTTLKADGSIPCPACGERMQKQALFFWQCECGAEWWPAEKIVPEDPDEWNMPARVAVDGGAIGIMQQMLAENKTYSEIAAVLVQAGYVTPRGKPWTVPNVKRFAVVYLKPDYQERRKRIEDLIRSMALQRYNCREIADRLNSEGYTTDRGKPWENDTVWWVVRKLLPDLEMSKGPNRYSLVRQPHPEGWIHPWRRGYEARAAAREAARRPDHAMPNMQGRDGRAG